LDDEQSPKKKRTSIPKKVRIDTWNICCGKNVIEGKCFCCKCIVRQEDSECSHFISVKNGGTNEIGNLRICCRNCNRSMGDQNMHEYMKQYGYDKIINTPSQVTETENECKNNSVPTTNNTTQVLTQNDVKTMLNEFHKEHSTDNANINSVKREAEIERKIRDDVEKEMRLKMKEETLYRKELDLVKKELEIKLQEDSLNIKKTELKVQEENIISEKKKLEIKYNEYNKMMDELKKKEQDLTTKYTIVNKDKDTGNISSPSNIELGLNA
jgi:hypothetical protein